MQPGFNFSVPPFDCLSHAEQQLVRAHAEVIQFHEGETVLDVGMAPGHLFVLIQGHVHQFEDHELISTYGPHDCFDERGLVAGRVNARFIAGEDILVHRIEKDTVTRLISSNARFGALLFADLSQKLRALSERHRQHELQSLTLTPVGQAGMRPAQCVEQDTDIVSVVKIFQAHGVTHVLVRDSRSLPPRLGIFTHTDLQRAILSGTPLSQLPVGELANYSLITARPADPLFDALALMVRHRVHRLVVTEDEHVVGVLEQLDLLDFLSNHSYLLTHQIVEARHLGELRNAAQRITQLITLLHRTGTRVGLIAKMVQALNARLFERTWELIAPPELRANSCLFVMGSEGRGEQILKTDQDNGLVLREGYDAGPDLQETCERFSKALLDFGYPTCPGGIMVRNPLWRHPVGEFAQQVRGWLLVPDPDSLMRLAIFLDAHPVCGDAQLLADVRQALHQLVPDNAAVLARFASAIEISPGGGHWWSRLLSIGEPSHERIDLKKAALFPLVHGVRSLAFEHRLVALGTVERLEALVTAGALPAELGADLGDSLHFFMELKLKAGLAALEAGRPLDNQIELQHLASLERDLLKDTLRVVQRFKSLLRQHFHLDAL